MRPSRREQGAGSARLAPPSHPCPGSQPLGPVCSQRAMGSLTSLCLQPYLTPVSTPLRPNFGQTALWPLRPQRAP